MDKRRISLLFIFVTVAAIAAFQAFWLRKTYEEEKRTFLLRSNILFKETVFKLEASKMHLDTFNVHLRNSSGTPGIRHVMEDKVMHDTLIRYKYDGGLAEKSVFVTIRENGPGDKNDSTKNIFYRGSNAKVVGFLANADSLQGTITMQEITDSYRAALDREGMHLPFAVSQRPGKEAFDPLPPDAVDNAVAVGFAKPVIYQLDFGNLFWFLARRVGPQVIFSLVLVGCTILSFVLLYRNWQQQRRLIQLKNDFISNITHELKTPIATVSVAVEALRNFNALQDPARTQEYLDISANELQRLSLLVDKVLKLSLFEREEIELKNDRFDLKGLVEEVMASMRLQFEKYRASLTLQSQGADFHVNADKLHITSVIFNLLDNALKYSRSDPAIQVSLEARTDQFILAVTDNGIGIPAAYKEKIFEKFFRVPSGDRHNVKGYGLGLSYVYYVLQRQGGEISVDSQEGAGSRFTVKLPRQHV